MISCLTSASRSAVVSHRTVEPVWLALDPHHVFDCFGDRVQVTDDRHELVAARLGLKDGE